jgi:hypothetical protein
VVLKDSSVYREPQYHRWYFSNKDCVGEPYADDYTYFSPCDGGGMSMQCVQKQTTPEFTKKDGLVT